MSNTQTLINHVALGVTRETELQEAVDKEFRGETMEVGLYLAMARQAQREGYPEIARLKFDSKTAF